MTRKMLFRRAVAAVAKEEAVPKSKTYTTVKRKTLTLAQAFLVSDLTAENRRLRGEVRRLRRMLRGILYSVSEPRGMAPKDVIMDGIKAGCEQALAPRRRPK